MKMYAAFFCSLAGVWLPGNLNPAHADTPRAAPPAVTETREWTPFMAPLSSGLPQDEYSIGQPTAVEQYMVELVNRARADAAAEAQRLKNTTDPDVLSAVSFFGTDLDLMVTQFATLEQNLPPLSISAELTEAARLHSQDMLDNVFQSHTSSSNPPAPILPNSAIEDRASAVGYLWQTVGENVYAFATSPWHAHAGFQIDWGNTPTGIQEPPGHRQNIHSTAWREIGIGIVEGSNTDGNTTVGPMLVTQDFGRQQSVQPFITGVAYYDLNGNDFYDIGEGLGGFTVEVDEAAPWAVTADSGGYSLPVTLNGDYTVTFPASG